MQPEIIQPDRQFREFLAQGRFMIQRSRSTGRYVFYPRVMLPGTGEQDLEWIEAGGGGTVYAATEVFPRPPEAAYNVVLVDLDEGPRMMSRVDGVDGLPAIGMRVRAKIAGKGQEGVVVFEPA